MEETERPAAKKILVWRALLSHLGENYLSVLPIVLAVLVIYFTHVDPNFTVQTLFAFLASALVIGLGLSLFTAGADQAMTRIGTIIGETLFKKRKMWLIVLMTFLIGVLVTVAEPDLKVMASQIGWDEGLLIVSVGVGVGLFVVFGVLRILFNQSLNIMFLAFYAIVFALASLVSVQRKELFLPIAFDSGGVTTGPVTVPFILAFGAGLASSRNGNGRSGEDAFGLTALASVGPIITVMVLSLFLDVDGMTYTMDTNALIGISTWSDFWPAFGQSALGNAQAQLMSVGVAILPLAGFFILYDLLFVHLGWKQILRILIGLLYAYIGLSIFLMAVETGFLPIAQEVGRCLGDPAHPEFFPIAVLIGGLFGLFGVLAEPAVHVLVRQIEVLSEGTIRSRTVLIVMALAIGGGVALAIVRAHFGFSIMYYMLPGYALSLALTFVVPKIYTAIAFDSGGVASGPMASTFVMPFAIGFTYANHPGENVVFQDAFGCVAMIALMPLIVIQLMGLYAEVKRDMIYRKTRKQFVEPDDGQVIHFTEAQS